MPERSEDVQMFLAGIAVLLFGALLGQAEGFEGLGKVLIFLGGAATVLALLKYLIEALR